MATNSSAVQQLYTDIVSDIVPFFENQVLLPNPQFIMNYFNIAGSAGNTVRVPKVNAYVNGAAVTEGNAISSDLSGTDFDFEPGFVNIALAKYGAWTNVTEESLEDGGMAMVRNQVITRLSRSLAQAVDVAGFTELADMIAQPVDGTTSHNGNYGAATTGTYKVNVVMSPEALGYAVKREPNVTVWYDNDKDQHQFRSTVRAGFKGVNRTFAKGVYASGTIGSSAATLAMFQKGVAALRAVNAPTMANGLYLAVVDPATEYAIASQLNSVTDASIGALSDLGNDALRSGALGIAAGCMFVRSNNLPSVTLS
jgi:hypothetical protein